MNTTKFDPIDKLSEAQVEQLVELYQGEWWTRGRTLADVHRMLAHTDIVVGFSESSVSGQPGCGRLAAFARVLTDGVYKALIFDFIVAAPHRGCGLGRALMEVLLAHPRLKDVRHLELYCLPELVPFYRRWGFTDELGTLRFMRASR